MNEPTSAERNRAIESLILKISPETLVKVLMGMQNKQTPWYCVQHFSLGIMVRNLLREAGFKWSDDYLDDHWHELVEEAALRYNQRPKINDL